MNILAQEAGAWQEAFAARARPLAARWRRQRLVGRLLTMLWLPMAINVVLLGVLRWTLIELPGQEAILLFPVPLWLAALGLWWLLDRPSLMRLARAGDRALGLDERLATALEGTQRLPDLDAAAARMVRRQREDALGTLSDREEQITRTFPIVPGRYLKPLAVAAGVSLLALPAMFLPSPVESQRAARNALRDAVLQQADVIGTARREAVERPNLPGDAGALIDEQLRAAEDRLRSAPTDRGGAVTALSQAEDRLRKALPSDFQQRLAASAGAARDIQSALPTDSRPDAYPAGMSDLAQAATAAELLADAAVEMMANPDQVDDVFVAAGSLERAAESLIGTDPALAEQLRAAAAAMRGGDEEAAQTTLKDAADGLRRLDANQTGISTIAQTIDKLGQSRATVAQAGLPTTAADTPDGGRPRFGPQAGAAGVDGTTPGGAPDPGGPGGGEGQGAQPGQGSNPDAGSGPGQSGQTGPSQTGGTGTGPSGGSTLAGGGGAGTTDPSGNQQGTGTGAGPTPGAGSPTDPGAGAETVYVPEGPTARGESTGPQDTLTLPGSAGDGAAKDSSVIRRGPGVNPGVHTPYQDVIGQYNTSAASALDRSAIPNDAKEYVRDYFRSLQPQP